MEYKNGLEKNSAYGARTVKGLISSLDNVTLKQKCESVPRCSKKP